MTAPETGAVSFLWACLLGAGLGILYGFLRPLRPKATWLADGFFVAAVLIVWLYLSFGICRGDIRLGCTLGLPAGGLIWELGAGWLLRPIFQAFWKSLGAVLGFIGRPLKKIVILQK